MASRLFPAARTQLAAGSLDWTAGVIRVLALPEGVQFDFTEEFLNEISAGVRIAISEDIEERAVNAGWYTGKPVKFLPIVDTRKIAQLVMYLDTGDESTSTLIARIDDDGLFGEPIAPQGVKYFLYPDATLGGFFYFVSYVAPVLTAELNDVADPTQLDWSAATSNPSGALLRYDIYRSINGADFSLLTTVASNVLTYQDVAGLNFNDTATYKVVAVFTAYPDATVEAESNEATVGNLLSAISGTPLDLAINETYSVQMSVEGGLAPLVWSISAGALPAGLSISSSTGLISGVVPVGTTEGDYTFTVRVVDDLGFQSTKACTISLGHLVALLHMDGTDGGTTFPDEVGTSWTRSSVTTATGQKKFGTASMAVAAGQYLKRAYGSGLDFSSGKWAIDGWFRPTTNGGTWGQFWNKSTGGSDVDVDCYVTHSNGLLTFGIGDTSSGFRTVGTTTISFASAFIHCALTCDGTKVYAFVDGVKVGDLTIIGAIRNRNTEFYLGIQDRLSANTQFSGHQDEIRIAKGIVRWTSDFTPPAAPSDFPVVP